MGIKTKMTHVYIVVQRDEQRSAEAGCTVYKVGCARRQGMPTVGPRWTRSPYYEKSSAFASLLVQKLINAEKAAQFAPSFLKQRRNLREWWLSQLYDQNVKK